MTHQSPLEFLATRKSVPISGLKEPGPDPETLTSILRIASRAPDHGRLEPWRFILFEGAARDKAGEIVLARFDALNPDATEQERDKERTRFNRAPLVIGVVSCPKESHIPEWEQFLSGAAVATQVLLAAQAHGFGANWITNWYSEDADVLAEFGLAPNERMIGFIHVGSAPAWPPERPRPNVDGLVTRFEG